MSILVIAEHDNSSLKQATLNVVAAAKAIGGDIDVNVGDEVEVLLEKTEDKEGHVLLSKSKAVKMRTQSRIDIGLMKADLI